MEDYEEFMPDEFLSDEFLPDEEEELAEEEGTNRQFTILAAALGGVLLVSVIVRTLVVPNAGSLPSSVQPVHMYWVAPLPAGLFTELVSTVPGAKKWLPTGGSGLPCSDCTVRLSRSMASRRSWSNCRAAKSGSRARWARGAPLLSLSR